MLGTPLADVKVHRDADTGRPRRQLSAKAFTAGGEVFLPDWHGSTSTRRGAHDPHPRTDPRRPATAARRVAAGRGVTGGCRTRVGSAIGRRARSSRADAARRAEPVGACRRSDSPASRRRVRCERRRNIGRHVRRNGRRVGCRRWTSSPGCRPPPARRGSRTPPAADDAGHPGPTPEPVTAPVSERTSGTAPPSIVQRLPGDSERRPADHHVDVVEHGRREPDPARRSGPARRTRPASLSAFPHPAPPGPARRPRALGPALRRPMT